MFIFVILLKCIFFIKLNRKYTNLYRYRARYIYERISHLVSSLKYPFKIKVDKFQRRKRGESPLRADPTATLTEGSCQLWFNDNSGA